MLNLDLGTIFLNKHIIISVTLALLFAIDWYVYQGLLLASRNASVSVRNVVKYAYWGLTVVSFAVILFYNFGNPEWLKGNSRSLIFTGIFINYFSKLFALIVLVFGDLSRVVSVGSRVFSEPCPNG